MKSLLFLLLVASFNSFAWVYCEDKSNDETLIIIPEKNYTYIEVYSQGGMGPNNLEASYVSNDRYNTNSSYTSLDLPFGGEIRLNNYRGKITGSIKYSKHGPSYFLECSKK